MVDMKPRVFSIGPPGSVVAIDDQGQRMVHSNDGFGKRKKKARSIPAVFSPALGFVTSPCRA
jgi:hypothetical protein